MYCSSSSSISSSGPRAMPPNNTNPILPSNPALPSILPRKVPSACPLRWGLGGGQYFFRIRPLLLLLQLLLLLLLLLLQLLLLLRW